MWRRTGQESVLQCERFLLTHPVWDVTRWNHRNYPRGIISTHTSRVGCDRGLQHRLLLSSHFYSHIPCGMWLCQPQVEILRNEEFLLTHPVWDVTAEFTAHRDSRNFYSHIPCGMWLVGSKGDMNVMNFYSHIPCGMWHTSDCIFSSMWLFLLTHPVWDVTLGGWDCIDTDFYSHIPCGMWHTTRSNSYREGWFLLTHPVWDVTACLRR